MRLHLDEDVASQELAAILRANGHDVTTAVDVGLRGESDVVEMTYVIKESRLILTANSDDFEEIHDLIRACSGHHPGILIVRFDNDRRRDLSSRGIARAIGRMESAGVVFADDIHIVNQWR